MSESLSELVQYLNLEEMRAFCRKHGLPLTIRIERADGTTLSTGDRDRKDIVLKRILTYVEEGRRDGPTVYPLAVVGKGRLPSPITPTTRVHHGQYEKHNPEFVELLRSLTDGRFKTGMIARLVLRDFWTVGVAPTMQAFADAWVVATDAHTQPRPEGAYLVDRWKGTAGPDWKQVRADTAARALQIMDERLASRGAGSD